MLPPWGLGDKANFKPNLRLMRKPMHHAAKSDLFEYVKYLRENMTKAETVLWKKIRNKRLAGFKFRNQHPIHVYILDFYCHETKLSIEVDGEYHLDKYQVQYDNDRTQFLAEIGIRELRFTNAQILENIDNVLEEIMKKLKSV
jgi:very-short-patch-repair endonuclease